TQHAARALSRQPTAQAILPSAPSPSRPSSEGASLPAPKKLVKETADDKLRQLSFAPTGGYDLVFWLCFIANSSIMVAVSILFRYADYIRLLGGGEWE